MYQISEQYLIVFPPDISGVIIFSKIDYSTIFVQFSLTSVTEYDNLTGEGLNLERFVKLCANNAELESIKIDLLKKCILVKKS